MAHPRDKVMSQTYQAVATSQPADTTARPPFSRELRVDKKLNLSSVDFKQNIEKFYANKQLSAIDQLKATPPYPTPHVLAQFASMAYRECKLGDPKPPAGWQLLTTASNTEDENGYYGTAYWHEEHQQVVISHRGTDTNNVNAFLNGIYTDLEGVLSNNYVPQMNSANTFANKVVTVLQEIEKEQNVSFDLFFTGHSLGGWLAQITTFTTEYLEVIGGTFLKKQKREQEEPLGSSTVQDSHDVTHNYHPQTVVFDSPGCKVMLSQMADKLDLRLHGSSIDLQHLDITSYLSAPNLINTCNSHLGTVYRIFIDLSDMGWKEKHTPMYNILTHNMDKIKQVFDPETGQVRKDDEGRPKILEVVDWPLSAGLNYGRELEDFFERAEHLNNYHPEVIGISHSNVPNVYPLLRYQTKAYDQCTKSLNVFTQGERDFLELYRWLREVPEFFKPEDLFSVMNNAEAEKEVEQKLRNFYLRNERIHCPEARILHALIPYVKRLVRIFPHIKEKVKEELATPQIRNRVYQYETQLSVEKVRKSAIVFNPGALDVREFLTSDKNIWQLRMNDGDAWTGITKVYQVLQNTSCKPNYSSKGQYTVLKLKRLLTVNRTINLNALLASMETPHLLMIACGTNQPVSDELRDMFKELFNILKQKETIKIILTTQSESDTTDFIEEIATETFGEGFITTDEQLTWSDLTASSQGKLLEKTVIFQGTRIALNQLISPGSITDSFPLAKLLQQTVLTIGKEPVPSAGKGYNEKYYIDRTFKHNIVIRQDISSDKRQGKFADLLASTEQEFKQLCQQNPRSKVHWLENDNSGELIWQQSQGDLKILREYIDPQNSHSYTPSDSENLLQQAKQQRVMLIADKAGMGKTTVLTQLSKQIKQTFPDHWLVRIDLNDYTELFNVQEGKKMDKEWVLEFITKGVLKLESRLEEELFKRCFEGNEISKLVVMVDGFDEISPRYKETVLDMLQVLKQTSLEQLWVTTRPHLREDLEDNLQQLSYTLQPFSEFEQVRFLKKFWTENLNLVVTNQDRLEIYATALIRKLAQSIRDKDKEFTGIPLQTRMLAEAFEKEFNSFYLSKDSEPVLPYKLGLLDLYRRFIENKYDIYYIEKAKIPQNNIAAEMVREYDHKLLQFEHQQLALQALLPENELTVLQIGYDSKFSDENLARIGIVQRNNKGKLHFIHRTFAEYCVAEFLFEKLTKNTKQCTQVQDFLLNEVLLKSDYQVMRNFLDGLLGMSMPSIEVLKDYGKKLDEQWKESKVQLTMANVTTALFQAATEDNAHIIVFIIESLKSVDSFNTVKAMMYAKNDKGKNAWRIAGENGSVQVLEKIWQWVELMVPTTDI